MKVQKSRTTLWSSVNDSSAVLLPLELLRTGGGRGLGAQQDLESVHFLLLEELTLRNRNIFVPAAVLLKAGNL